MSIHIMSVFVVFRGYKGHLTYVSQLIIISNSTTMSGTMATQCGSYLIPIAYKQQELLMCFPKAILFMYIFDDIVFIEKVTKVFLNIKISFLIDYA